MSNNFFRCAKQSAVTFSHCVSAYNSVLRSVLAPLVWVELQSFSADGTVDAGLLAILLAILCCVAILYVDQPRARMSAWLRISLAYGVDTMALYDDQNDQSKFKRAKNSYLSPPPPCICALLCAICKTTRFRIVPISA
jgi:hypothetical protein